jgi:glycoside/pentoside/hexuronide:cation symporter, GPH family
MSARRLSPPSGFFLNAFLLDIAGIRPGAAGIIFLIVKIWDSVNDPIIGRLTDRTNTRWGRRRPWLLFGAIPFGLAWFLQWLVPDLSASGLFWYYLVVALLLDTGFTAVNVPYTALTPELTQDYDERTSLNSYRFSFSILGGLAALAVHSVLVDSFDQRDARVRPQRRRHGGRHCPQQPDHLCLHGRSYFKEAKEEEDPGFVEGVKIALSNRPFLYVVTIYLLSWLCIQFVQANMLLYVRYWVGGRGSLHSAHPLPCKFHRLCLFAHLVRVSLKWGKQNVYYVGMSFWIVWKLRSFSCSRGSSTLLFTLAILAGVGVSVGYLIPWSMLPDVIEYWTSWKPASGAKASTTAFLSFCKSWAFRWGWRFSNFALEAAGYVNPEGVGAPFAEQPASVLLVLRLFVSIVPAVVLLASFYVVYRYPITREKHAEMRAELARRAATVDQVRDADGL